MKFIIPDKFWASSTDSAELSMGMFVITTSSTMLAITSEHKSDFSSALIKKMLSLRKSLEKNYNLKVQIDNLHYAPSTYIYFPFCV
jgi:hypothetical protein